MNQEIHRQKGEGGGMVFYNESRLGTDAKSDGNQETKTIEIPLLLIPHP